MKVSCLDHSVCSLSLCEEANGWVSMPSPLSFLDSDTCVSSISRSLPSADVVLELMSNDDVSSACTHDHVSLYLCVPFVPPFSLSRPIALERSFCPCRDSERGIRVRLRVRVPDRLATFVHPFSLSRSSALERSFCPCRDSERDIRVRLRVRVPDRLAIVRCSSSGGYCTLFF